MDTYGQIGPDQGDYDADLYIIAKRLDNGQGVQVAHTYRMTRIEIVLVPWRVIEAHGAPKPQPEGIPLVFVAVVGKGAEWLHLDSNLHWTATSEYLGVTNDVDAEAIAKFLNRIGEILMGEAVPS